MVALNYQVYVCFVFFIMHGLKWVSFHWFKYNTLGCCIGFHGNISVKARIPRKQFDICTQILVTTMAACYVLLYETFPL